MVRVGSILLMHLISNAILSKIGQQPRLDSSNKTVIILKDLRSRGRLMVQASILTKWKKVSMKEILQIIS